jgi:integrase
MTKFPQSITKTGRIMGIGKQAKILNEHQFQALLAWLATRKHADRNRLVVLLSFKSGLRAKEIASLKWSMVIDAAGEIAETIHLRNQATKGKSGRLIAMNQEVRKQLMVVASANDVRIEDAESFVIKTQRGDRTSAQAVVNMFRDWYRKLGFVGSEDCDYELGENSKFGWWKFAGRSSNGRSFKFANDESIH